MSPKLLAAPSQEMSNTFGMQRPTTCRTVLAAFLMAMTLAGTAIAGLFEDASVAYERGDYATALRLFQSLASGGDGDAQFNVARMYETGQGAPQDYAEALKWYRKAADQGVAAAQGNLADMYTKGEGVPRDYGEAAKWYRKAADQGDANAQNNLGIMNAKGEGVPRDYVEAYKWLDLAASRYVTSEKENSDKVIKNRDLIADKMTPAQIAEAQKRAREWKPTK